MDNKKQLLLLVVAVAVGILATVMTSSYITHRIEDQSEQMREEYEAKQKQMVASLQQQSEQKMAVLAEQINRAKQEQAEALQKQMADMQARLQSQQKAAVPTKRIKPSMAAKTPSGKRAVTIMIESLAAVGGLLNPGDMVDVIARLNVPSSGLSQKPEDKKAVTAMIFQGLEVLAVNTNLEETGAYYDEQQNAPALRVTVAVDPEEAGLLSFASQNGRLELALRAPQETDHQMVKASTWKTLADYVLQNQGADINIPSDMQGPTDNKDLKPMEQKPGIQIFRGGKEL